MGDVTRTANAAVDNAAAGVLAWANPGNACASDNTYALATESASGGRQTHYLQLSFASYDAPVGASNFALTFEVDIVGKALATQRVFLCQLHDNGTLIGENQAASEDWTNTTEQTRQYAKVLWGVTKTDAQWRALLNSGTMGVMVQGSGTSASPAERYFEVDTGRLRVTWDDPVATFTPGVQET